IDDKPPALTDGEKQATVRDLLMARSGVYHEAAAENDHMKQVRPERGSHRHGTFWYYNNWDFNVLGTIYRQRTSGDIFGAGEPRTGAAEHRSRVRSAWRTSARAKGGKVTSRRSLHPRFICPSRPPDLGRSGGLT